VFDAFTLQYFCDCPAALHPSLSQALHFARRCASIFGETKIVVASRTASDKADLRRFACDPRSN
jgi:hypothetical protein